jgi:hypothetical protein
MTFKSLRTGAAHVFRWPANAVIAQTSSLLCMSRRWGRRPSQRPEPEAQCHLPYGSCRTHRSFDLVRVVQAHAFHQIHELWIVT